jgi:hypothetical protein
MKLIITEDKIRRAFTKFMDEFVDLTYHAEHVRHAGEDIMKYEFLTKEGNTFGNMYQNDAFFPSYSEYEKMDDFFGDKTDELLLQYLRNKFGDEILFKRIA